jgi:hypothetical protein
MPKEVPLDFGEQPYLWPTPGDAAFRAGDPAKPDVSALKWLGGVMNPWRAYADGYRSAAERLGNLISDPTSASNIFQPEIDQLALPLVSLWRHYIELILKALIPELRDLMGDMDQQLKYDHNLRVSMAMSKYPRVADVGLR